MAVMHFPQWLLTHWKKGHYFAVRWEKEQVGPNAACFFFSCWGRIMYTFFDQRIHVEIMRRMRLHVLFSPRFDTCAKAIKMSKFENFARVECCW